MDLEAAEHRDRALRRGDVSQSAIAGSGAWAGARQDAKGDASHRAQKVVSVEKSVDLEQDGLARVDWLRPLAARAVVGAAASVVALVPCKRDAVLSAARSCAGAERWAAAKAAEPLA